MERITCFFSCTNSLKESSFQPGWGHYPFIKDSYLLSKKDGTFNQSSAISRIVEQSNTEFTLICMNADLLAIEQGELERMVNVLESSGAGMLYTDYRIQSDDSSYQIVPLIDCGQWPMRDSFDFGPVLLFYTDYLKESLRELNPHLQYSALYWTLLHLSIKRPLLHLPEVLYTQIEQSDSSDIAFAYVDTKNRDAQKEIENSFLDCLQRKGAWLKPIFKKIDLTKEKFATEASVIIPVYNRETTIESAVRSALSQETDFSFNIIVVENHSTDNTFQILQNITDDRLIVLQPESHTLGIGGCWNYAIEDYRCGRFAVQLDSDDLYNNTHTLQKIVNAFYEQQVPMIVGSYRITDFDLNTIPPGVIDHREWTEENGRNNLLRVNGIGAPRAFYTPLVRSIRFPNTSYGEDYAMALRISRDYKIGRLYDILYDCRRWHDNTDASLSIEKMNANNRYKDCLRHIELTARMKINEQSCPLQNK